MSTNFYLHGSFEEKLNKVICETISSVFDKDISYVTLEYPQKMEHGDFACNAAMQLAKELQMNPREIAQQLVDAFPDVEEIENIEIAGPGFINFFLSKRVLFQSLISMNEDYGKNIVNEKKTIITDISHPNAAKPMGVHHLLSTIIGDAINNILDYIGHDLVRDSYWGDWGTQFGKLMYALKNWGDKEKLESDFEKDLIPELLKLYVEFHNKAEEDPMLEQAARDEFKKLEDGDEENKKIWEWLVSLSKKEFFKLYDRLDIKFDTYYGESFYFPYIPEVIEEGKEKDIFSEGEGGAIVVEFEDENIPTCPVIKSDGATLYHTRDIARIKYWMKEKQPQEMIYVVDSAQKLHFIQLFEMAQMFGWGDTSFTHTAFGRMRFKDKSMSTRKGNILLMEEVLDEAEQRALALIEEKESTLPQEDRVQLSKVMGVGSVKYSILAQNRNTDIVFDWERMLSFEGNAAPYIQYTYARSRSILRKFEGDISPEIPDDISLNDKERALLIMLTRFPQVLVNSAEEYYPHILCNYIYELAHLFNSYYNSTQVLNEENESLKNLRLMLVDKVGGVLKNSMKILGIVVPEKM